ncbi:MAG: cation:proton antiporter, partial [Thermoleophilaceae bacterium]|nr:cation:proton antiporter [Thermoleophilaceae bacterium]
VQALNRSRFASAGLYPVASIAAAALSFGVADVLHGSGFLAVYLTGLTMGTSLTQAKRTIVTFHEGLAWVAQVGMFLTLGLLVFPSQLGDVALEGTVLAVILTVVARSAATVISTLPFRYGARERLTLSWAGLRGAVPVVLATFPITAGVASSLDFFNIVFFAVLISTLLQGASFEPLAKRLGMTTNEAALPRPLAEAGTIRRLGAEVVEFPVWQDDAIAGRMIRELGLPREALLNVIVRGDQAIPPRGSTRVEAGDRLHILVRQEVAIEFRELLERWRNGPIGRPPRKPLKARSSQAIASSRPWRAQDGDAGHPQRVGGADVVEQLRTRRDGVPGALVVLDDGRFAVTGPVVAIGSSQALQRNARRRIASARSDGERAWWAEVVAALVGEELRP